MTLHWWTLVGGLLALALLAQLAQLHQAAHDLTQLHPASVPPKHLSLDLKFPCIPEIKVQATPQVEVSNTHDEIPIVLITSEDSKSSACIDFACDSLIDNPRSAPHDSPNSIDLVPTQTKTTSSSNNASFSQTNGRAPWYKYCYQRDNQVTDLFKSYLWSC